MEEKHLQKNRYEIRIKGRIVWTHTHALLKWGFGLSLSLAKMQCFIVLQCSKHQRQWYIPHKKTHEHTVRSAAGCLVRLRSSWNWLKLKGRAVCSCHLQMVWQRGWLAGWMDGPARLTVFCAPWFDATQENIRKNFETCSFFAKFLQILSRRLFKSNSFSLCFPFDRLQLWCKINEHKTQTTGNWNWNCVIFSI